jgi:ATP/ADP translocase
MYQSRAQWSPIAGLLFFNKGDFMATRIKKKTVKQAKKVSVSPFNNYWNKTNYYLLGLGLVVTFIGFYAMSIGPWNSFSSLVLSPIILFIAYVIIFPLSIFVRKKSEKKSTEDNQVDTGKS